MKRNKDDARIIAERINQILVLLARPPEHIDSHLIENLESFTK
jgi:hypothetical protein